MQLPRSIPNLKTKTSRIRLDDKTLETQIRRLEEELEDMFIEYDYMDCPIKARLHAPSITTIDEILWICLTDN